MTKDIVQDPNLLNTETQPQRSAFQNLYDELGIFSPLELSNKFSELDQAEMQSGKYDYDDESTVNNIKARLEAIDPDTLNDEEKHWRAEMLWLWYHHAAGYALFGNIDTETAQRFSGVALSHQAEDHTNKITALICFLARGDVKAARDWVEDEVSEAERAAAEDTISNYIEHVLPKVRNENGV